MKKLIALLLAVLMLVSLAACATGTDTTTDSQDTATTDDTAATDAATDDAATDDAATDDAAEGEQSNLEKSLAIDVSGIMSTDNQPLFPEMVIKDFPERPEDPEALGEDETGHWYDMENAGWDAVKSTNLPTSPADGCIGKEIYVIVHGDHPWTTAYTNGINKACEAYGMTATVLSPNWDVNLQNQQIDQAINAQPDAIILIPVNAESAVQQFRKITEAGIPAFGSNLLTTSAAMEYMIAWTGPDDWGQMRELARNMADDMGKEGGVCYLTHNPGGSAYFACMFGPRTELNEYAPDITTLDFQSPGFDAAACKQTVSDWITKFGDDLNAIFCADDSAQLIGTIDALKEANRTDILVYAAGNSKTGQDYVKAGDVKCINYQSAEGDAAAAVQAVAKWFNGEEVAPMAYMAPVMINGENVDSFYPCQW